VVFCFAWLCFYWLYKQGINPNKKGELTPLFKFLEFLKYSDYFINLVELDEVAE
jgi:hypothetical protein